MNRRKFLGVAAVLPALPALTLRPGSNKLPAKLDHSGSLGMAMPKLEGATSQYDPAWLKIRVDGSTAYVPVF